MRVLATGLWAFVWALAVEPIRSAHAQIRS